MNGLLDCSLCGSFALYDLPQKVIRCSKASCYLSIDGSDGAKWNELVTLVRAGKLERTGTMYFTLQLDNNWRWRTAPNIAEASEEHGPFETWQDAVTDAWRTLREGE